MKFWDISHFFTIFLSGAAPFLFRRFHFFPLSIDQKPIHSPRRVYKGKKKWGTFEPLFMYISFYCDWTNFGRFWFGFCCGFWWICGGFYGFLVDFWMDFFVICCWILCWVFWRFLCEFFCDFLMNFLMRIQPRLVQTSRLVGRKPLPYKHDLNHSKDIFFLKAFRSFQKNMNWLISCCYGVQYLNDPSL